MILSSNFPASAFSRQFSSGRESTAMQAAAHRASMGSVSTSQHLSCPGAPTGARRGCGFPARSPLCPATSSRLCSNPSALPPFVSLELFGGKQRVVVSSACGYLEKENAIVGEDNAKIKCLKFSISHCCGCGGSSWEACRDDAHALSGEPM